MGQIWRFSRIGPAPAKWVELAPPTPTWFWLFTMLNRDSNSRFQDELGSSSPIEQCEHQTSTFKRKTTIIIIIASRVKVQADHNQCKQNLKQELEYLGCLLSAFTNHPGETDFENFRSIFPSTWTVKFGSDGVRPEWQEIRMHGWVKLLNGIFWSFKFLPESKKMLCRIPHLGWMLTVDWKRWNTYMPKTFCNWWWSKLPRRWCSSSKFGINAGSLLFRIEVCWVQLNFFSCW